MKYVCAAFSWCHMCLSRLYIKMGSVNLRQGVLAHRPSGKAVCVCLDQRTAYCGSLPALWLLWWGKTNRGVTQARILQRVRQSILSLSQSRHPPKHFCRHCWHNAWLLFFFSSLCSWGMWTCIVLCRKSETKMRKGIPMTAMSMVIMLSFHRCFHPKLLTQLTRYPFT